MRFETTGSYGAALSDQLNSFTTTLVASGLATTTPEIPRSWQDAFQLLIQLLEKSWKRKRSKRREVLFFDELPWLASPRSRFLQAFEHFWNSWASKQGRLIVVVCESAASWMLSNVLRNKGGLHNRVTRRVRQLPFTLGEVENYVRSRHAKWGRKDILELYMALGGVPHYLKEIDPAHSVAQNMDCLCFRPESPLREELEQVFKSLFDNDDRHVAIVKELASKPSGLTRKNLLTNAEIPSGGTLTKFLTELEESGFIEQISGQGRARKESLYRLIDEFSYFHLKWMTSRKHKKVDYWLSVRNTPAWRAWSGYAFESLCHRHTDKIGQALGIAGVQAETSSWVHIPKKSSELPGAQIDRLLDRADGCINLYEMKFSEDVFTINKRYAEELRRKFHVFREITHTRSSILPVMLITYGCTKNAWFHELIATEVTMEALF
ncbi:MAG: hypothetical protein ACI8T1_004794 [Verrucomicrobiales bacterium]|jgi:hypothetical protein